MNRALLLTALWGLGCAVPGGEPENLAASGDKGSEALNLMDADIAGQLFIGTAGDQLEIGPLDVHHYTFEAAPSTSVSINLPTEGALVNMMVMVTRPDMSLLGRFQSGSGGFEAKLGPLGLLEGGTYHVFVLAFLDGEYSVRVDCEAGSASNCTQPTLTAANTDLTQIDQVIGSTECDGSFSSCSLKAWAYRWWGNPDPTMDETLDALHTRFFADEAGVDRTMDVAMVDVNNELSSYGLELDVALENAIGAAFGSETSVAMLGMANTVGYRNLTVLMFPDGQVLVFDGSVLR